MVERNEKNKFAREGELENVGSETLLGQIGGTSLGQSDDVAGWTKVISKRAKWKQSPAKADGEVGLLAAMAVGLRSTLRTTSTENILDGTEHILEEGSLGPEE